MNRREYEYQKKLHDSIEWHGGVGGPDLRDFILGGQDGLVNVLGILLGLASATNDARIVIIAGLAATFAESISMAAVAYTSTKAEKAFYEKTLSIEKKEVEEVPEVEKEEIREIYRNKGFKGRQLELIVKQITSDKHRWVKEMMQEEHGLSPNNYANPVKSCVIVGLSAVIGSLIPLVPFVIISSVPSAIIASVLLSLIVLFLAGIIKAKFTVGEWWKAGLEMMLIGGVAAVAGYLIGAWLGMAFGTLSPAWNRKIR